MPKSKTPKPAQVQTESATHQKPRRSLPTGRKAYLVAHGGETLYGPCSDAAAWQFAKAAGRGHVERVGRPGKVVKVVAED